MRRLSPPAAISLFYAASFAVLGVQLPYLNLYLDAIGLGSLEIGVLSALIPLCGVVVPTVGGLLADRLGRRRSIVLVSTALALVAFIPILLVRGFGGVALVIGLYALARAPGLPLVEASAIEIAGSGGPAYGRMRAWGSFAFIVAALCAAPVVGQFGERSMLYLMIGLLAGCVATAVLLPADPGGDRVLRPSGSARAILRRPGVLLFLAGAVLSQAAHGPYYVFFSLHLKDAGLRTTTVGLLWAVAIGCEILMMLQMPAILARFGTGRTMTLCLGLSTLRWAVCAATVNPLAVALAQTFHAGTFAAFHVAAITHTYVVFGKERSATGQAIFSSMTYGLGNIVGMVGSGLFQEILGTPTLFAGASAMAFVATCLMAPLAWGHKSIVVPDEGPANGGRV
jgi:MFS transporter, PPP family, 3-phenylpropionic acid transporter